MYLITENNAFAEEVIGKICEVLGREHRTAMAANEPGAARAILSAAHVRWSFRAGRPLVHSAVDRSDDAATTAIARPLDVEPEEAAREPQEGCRRAPRSDGSGGVHAGST